MEEDVKVVTWRKENVKEHERRLKVGNMKIGGWTGRHI